MKVIGIIPARYGSTRFPGKPLASIQGITMIERVYRRAQQAKSLSKIIVATDDSRIMDEVKRFEGEVMMTSETHSTGTERCGEVIKNLKEHFEIAINIQGDEPFLHPEQIDEVVSCFKSEEVKIATLVKKIETPEELKSPNVVKAVVSKNNQALYFSRSPIPYMRDTEINEWLKRHTYYKHIGIYGFRIPVLQELLELKTSPLEKTESLEQLRWIENGYSISVHETGYENIAIDTMEDLAKVNV